MVVPPAAGLPVPDRTELVPLGLITTDHRVNTRPLDDDWVRRRVDHFNPAGLGVLAVSHRGDGTFVVLDGQHRRALAAAVGYGGQNAVLLCSIYEGLDLAQEAGLVVLLNDGRALKAVHKFLARVTEGDDIALAIAAICVRSGWRIAANRGAGVIVAVATLERIHRADMRAMLRFGGTPVVLEQTLSTLALAWGHDEDATNESIIGGIAALYALHGEAISKDHLIGRLKDLDGEAGKLYRRARGYRESRPRASIAACVAALVTDEYNYGMKSRKLPRFFKD